jgi:tetratricopeptide (TPR) repeat protein
MSQVDAQRGWESCRRTHWTGITAIIALILAAGMAYGQTSTDSGLGGGDGAGGFSSRQSLGAFALGAARQPLFISGRIILDDGSAPEQIAAIESVCIHHSRVEGYTTSRGQFQFRLGGVAAGMQDASASSPGGMGGRVGDPGLGAPASVLADCELRVKLPGFRADPVRMVNLLHGGNPDVGAIVLHRVGAAEGSVVSATTLRAPKAASNAFEKGRNAARGNQWRKAATEFQKAVDAYPEFSLAWFELGKAQQAGKQPELAEASFEQAVKADPKFLDPYLGLATLYLTQKKWPELARATENAVRLDPYDYPQAYLLNAVANYNTKRLDAAEKSALAAAKLDTRQQYPEIGRLLEALQARRTNNQRATAQPQESTRVTLQAANAKDARAPEEAAHRAQPAERH